MREESFREAMYDELRAIAHGFGKPFRRDELSRFDKVVELAEARGEFPEETAFEIGEQLYGVFIRRAKGMENFL